MNILLAIIVLGILVFIHELGHFIAAKLCGVYVEKFSIGFGPRLFGKKIGETDYCFSAFPLGGFVKMYGEKDETPDPLKAGRAFSDKSAWKKAIIIIAGPLANLILAVVIFSGIFMTGYPTYKAVVGNVTDNSSAYSAGLKAGDLIVAVDGRNIRSWSEFDSIINENPDKELSLKLSNDEIIKVTPTNRTIKNIFGEPDTIGDIGAEVYVAPIIGTIQQGLPASDSGLKSGDKILEVNGEKISTWRNSSEKIRSHPNETISIKVERDGNELSFEITPKLTETLDQNGEKISVGLIGITPQDGDMIMHHGLFESIGLGFTKSYEFTKIILLSIVKLIERVVPVDSLGGPIMIVQMTADSAKSGIETLLSFMAIISVNLAIFNLLPIPVLDGGQLVIIIIEAITRRKLSEKFIGTFQMFGFAILMCLMVFAFYNDIVRLLVK